MLVALERGGVAGGEHLSVQGATDGICHRVIARPEVGQEHRLAVTVEPERLGGEVEVHGAGDRVGNDQWRRGQVVHLDVWVDTPFEVAVSRQHGDDGEVVLLGQLADAWEQRSGVTNAGRATEAHEVEAEGFEARHEPSALEVVHDHPRTWSEGGLHPRLRGESPLVGCLGNEASSDEHRGVRGVGARGDGGNDDRTVGQCSAICARDLLGLVTEDGGERRAGLGEGDAVLRARWASQGRLHGGEVEFDDLGEDRLWAEGVVPEALGLGVGLDDV